MDTTWRAVTASVVRVEGDAAFERLFRAEYARVAAVANRVLADPDAAEDVAQDVFVSFRGRHDANAPWAAAWLHQAAAHAALKALRGRTRRAKRETAQAIPFGATSPDPAESALQAERRAVARAALARLPERTATLLVLRYSGLSYAEVAAATGVGANQIGTLLRRAEAAFRKEVGDAFR